MTKLDQTHYMSQTSCIHMGGTCPALARMLETLTAALNKARPVTTDDFEICGESKLDGCQRNCPARFFAAHDRIRVFCDVSQSAEREDLDHFADMLMDPRQIAKPAIAIQERPCAFGEVRPRVACAQPAPFSYSAQL